MCTWELAEVIQCTRLVSRVLCTPEVPFISPRQSAAAHAWPLFSSINQTDQMLAHLQSFSSVPEHFTLPDSTKSGVPLFYIPPGSSTPVSGPQTRAPLMLCCLEAKSTTVLKSEAPEPALALKASLLPAS